MKNDFPAPLIFILIQHFENHGAGKVKLAELL